MKRLLLALAAAVCTLAAATAGEFKLPVPFVILDNSKGDFCKPTVDAVTSGLAETKVLREWLRQGTYGEKRLVLEVEAGEKSALAGVEMAPVTATWRLVTPGAPDRAMGKQTISFRGGYLGTRLNTNTILRATRDVVYKLVDEADR